MIKKLTLSVDEDVISDAKAIAESTGTSVSTMFERFVRTMKRKNKTAASITPIAKKLTGVIKFPSHKQGRTVLEDALLKKHGFDK